MRTVRSQRRVAALSPVYSSAGVGRRELARRHVRSERERVGVGLRLGGALHFFELPVRASEVARAAPRSVLCFGGVRSRASEVGEEAVRSTVPANKALQLTRHCWAVLGRGIVGQHQSVSQ